MHPGLARLILDYQAAVKRAVDLMFASGIPIPASTMDWVVNKIPQRGTLAGGIRYFKHGYGCLVELPEAVVDFDFGANGEINGFDVWRLERFAGPNLAEYGFSDKRQLETAFKAGIASGSVLYSGYILYYLTTDRREPPEAFYATIEKDRVKDQTRDFKIKTPNAASSRYCWITPFFIGGIALIIHSLIELSFNHAALLPNMGFGVFRPIGKVGIALVILGTDQLMRRLIQDKRILWAVQLVIILLAIVIQL